jgi:hypothetical protein
MGDSDSETSYEGAPNIVLSSEIGVCPELPDSEVKIKNRLEPGKMYLVDFETLSDPLVEKHTKLLPLP